MQTEKVQLHPDTRLGCVHIKVSDLERSLSYYQRSLVFELHRQDGNTVFMGAGAEDLLLLTELPGARRVNGRTGLYHFAILLPSRGALAKALLNLKETGTRIDGAADHLVSEALYLSDPDGNGIELYRDRPRSDWQYEGKFLKMTVDPLDVSGLMAEVDGRGRQWVGLPEGTRLGHMHLHVSHLQQAEDFYSKIIGYDVMFRMHGSASFLSAGGYHHHLGINTWNGVGAQPPPSDAVGLLDFTVNLVDQQQVSDLAARLELAGIEYKRHAEGLQVQDPSENVMLFLAGR